MVTLQAEPREQTGQSHNRRLREEKQIPAVIYGRTIENRNLKVNAPKVRQLLKQGALNNVLVDLEIAGEDEPRNVLIKDVDLHPVKSSLRHVDFHQVEPEDEVQVKVPVTLTGESVGVDRDDGIVDQPIRELRVLCKAIDMPGEIELDITPLEIGDAIFVRDVDVPPGVELLDDGDRTVVSVQPPEEYDLEVEPAVEEATIEEAVEEAMEEAVEEGEELEEGEEGEAVPEEGEVDEAEPEEEPEL